MLYPACLMKNIIACCALLALVLPWLPAHAALSPEPAGLEGSTEQVFQPSINNNGTNNNSANNDAITIDNPPADSGEIMPFVRKKTPPQSNAPILLPEEKVMAGFNSNRYQFLPLPNMANPQAQPALWPILASQPLQAEHKSVTRAVILLHDADRSAAGMLDELVTAAAPMVSGSQATAMLIAPLFAAPTDRAIMRPLLGDVVDSMAVWEPAQWWQGGAAVAEATSIQAATGVSSMQALDLLLIILADKKLFPALEQVVLAGYGSGADLVHRYALYGRAADVLAAQKLPIRYVVGAAQSYVYLTDNRPQKNNSGFAVPADKATCGHFQDYPYGLEQPNPYAARTAGNVARQNYPAHDVHYVISAGDTSLANNPIPNQANTQNCAVLMQGKSVKDRATNYVAHLKTLFADTLRHKLLIIPSNDKNNDKNNTEQRAMKLFSSACGMSLLFAAGECLDMNTPMVSNSVNTLIVPAAETPAASVASPQLLPPLLPQSRQ